MQCAVNNGASAAPRLAVIDFSLPSSERRLWIFDLEKEELLLENLVAHGQKSGDNHATQFSNTVGSHQSSIGLFRTSSEEHTSELQSLMRISYAVFSLKKKLRSNH